MKNTTQLIFGLNFEPPLGLPDYVMEQNFHEIYWPYFNVIRNFSFFKVNLHCNGILLDWLEHFHPEFIGLLQNLVQRGQVEFLTGGFFSPILPILNKHDQLGQIKLLTEKIKKIFKVSPAGIWLAEKVFSPEVVATLADLGMDYTFLDEFQFRESAAKDLSQPLVMDHFGKSIKLLANHQQLKRIFTVEHPEKIVLLLRKISQPARSNCFSLFCSQKIPENYFIHFIELLLANQGWLKVARASDCLDEVELFSNVFVKDSAPQKIHEASGGAFQNYFSNYPAAKHIYRRMLLVSEKLHTLAKNKGILGLDSREEKVKQAFQHLYRAQNNFAYWPGSDGGIALAWARDWFYQNLLAAEDIADTLTYGNKKYAELSIADFDGDSWPEIIVKTDLFNAFFSPRRGGTLAELDFKPAKINFCDTFGDSNAGHHCLKDFVLSPGTSLNAFMDDQYQNLAGYADQEYMFLPQKKTGEVAVKLVRETESQSGVIRISKTITFLAGLPQILIDYEIKNCSDRSTEFLFGVEFALKWMNSARAGEVLDIEKTQKVRLFDADHKIGVSLLLSETANLWQFPIETNVQSDEELIKLKQGIALIPNWKLILVPQAIKTFSVRLLFE